MYHIYIYVLLQIEFDGISFNAFRLQSSLQIPKFKYFSSRLAVVFAQSIDARC